MTGGFQVDGEWIGRHAAEFAGHADRAAEITIALRDTLDGLAGCWGSDEVGRSFAAGHVAEADEVLDRLGALPRRLGAMGDRFAGTAAEYRRAESGNLGVLRFPQPGADR